MSYTVASIIFNHETQSIIKFPSPVTFCVNHLFY